MSIALRDPSISELKILKRWRTNAFWVCLIGYIGYYLCRKNLSAAFPLMEQAFGFTNSELGLIAFYSELAYAAGKFINGPLADRVGGKKIFLLGMGGAIACNLIFAMGDNLIYFIVVWCFCRYFLSMGWGALVKIIGHWYEPERNGTIMGMVSLNFQFGGVVATLFAGFLVAQGTGWQGIFIYPPLVLFIIFIWTALSCKETPRDVIADTNFGHGAHKAVVSEERSDKKLKSHPITIVKGLLSLSIFRHVLVFSFFTTFLRSIFFFWTPKLLVDLGMDSGMAILKSALFPFLGSLGTILLGWYTDKYVLNGDRARPMWIMLVGLVVSLLAIAWCVAEGGMNNTIVVLLGFAGFFLLGPYSMSSGALTLDIAGPNAAGSATGMIDSLGYVGGALAVWIAGALSDELGWGEVFQLLAMCATLATISAYFMSRDFQKRYKEKQ
ncbi:MAG: MFS transporter [Bacteriovoracaceae bacterium]|nr:MFS transporter [Bacteriovoracaceae bacterium]